MKYIEDFIVNEKESLVVAYWKFKNNNFLVVVNDDGKFIGVIGNAEFKNCVRLDTEEALKLVAGDICNKNCIYCMTGADIYKEVRNLFSEYISVWQIPIIDQNHKVVDIFTRQRAFYKQYYFEDKLIRRHYAFTIWNAARDAKLLGYDTISVLEFGVGSGNSLLDCEFHVQEIQRIFDIKIEVFGFDSSQGLPENDSRHDASYFWQKGDYPMNKENLEKRLQFSTMIYGDITETSKTFIEKYKPAPIGVMFVDVDYYSSTVPILKMFESNVENFTPRILMYFDDVSFFTGCSGEELAIKEFNQDYEYMKITPESYISDGMHFGLQPENFEQKRGIKVCHLFNHPLYNMRVYPDPNGIAMTQIQKTLR